MEKTPALEPVRKTARSVAERGRSSKTTSSSHFGPCQRRDLAQGMSLGYRVPGVTLASLISVLENTYDSLETNCGKWDPN